MVKIVVLKNYDALIQIKFGLNTCSVQGEEPHSGKNHITKYFFEITILMTMMMTCIVDVNHTETTFSVVKWDP